MERFFGAAAIQRPTEAIQAPLETGVHCVKVPLEMLLQDYVVSYGNLLNPKDRQVRREDASERESDKETTNEPEDNNDMDEDEISTDAKTKKPKKKSKTRKRDNQERFVGDYDLDDPFIDDGDVAVAYESVFDLFGPDNSDADALDSEYEQDYVLDKPPLREFYVFRGEIQVEVVSKLRYIQT